MVSKNLVMKELKKVMDPEIGISIAEMGLIDKVSIENGNISVEFHLTTQFCPPMFASQMASDIKKFVSKLSGVKSVKVKLKDHYMSEEINKQVNK